MGYLTHGATACGKTYDLLPCPFCGGEAEFHEYTGRSVEVALANRCDVPAMIKCERCGAMVSFNTGTRSTRRDAADAWNRRAERTCRMVDCGTHDTCVVNKELGNGNFVSQEFGYKQCSGCGAYVFDCPTVRYCPDCGARVVG